MFENILIIYLFTINKTYPSLICNFFCDAGWSSPVARQAHNLKVVGSNPTPATKFIIFLKKNDCCS